MQIEAANILADALGVEKLKDDGEGLVRVAFCVPIVKQYFGCVCTILDAVYSPVKTPQITVGYSTILKKR